MKNRFIILFLLSISACTKPVELDLPNYNSKLVVNGELDSEKDIEVQVSRSLPILQATDSTGYLIPSATVSVFENNVPIGPANFFSGKYVLAKKPIPGATYRIEVKSGNYPVANANLVMPKKTPLTVTYKDSIGLDADGFKIGQLVLNFTDDGSTKNYYKMLIRYYNSGINTWFPFNLVSNDILFLNNDKLNDGSYLFSDRTFSGKTKILTFNVQSTLVDGTPKFEISIKNFNEEYYNYLIQTDDYSQDGNGFTNDPVILRTNVSNGLGMVGGVSNAKDTIF